MRPLGLVSSGARTPADQRSPPTPAARRSSVRRALRRCRSRRDQRARCVRLQFTRLSVALAAREVAVVVQSELDGAIRWPPRPSCCCRHSRCTRRPARRSPRCSQRAHSNRRGLAQSESCHSQASRPSAHAADALNEPTTRWPTRSSHSAADSQIKRRNHQRHVRALACAAHVAAWRARRHSARGVHGADAGRVHWTAARRRSSRSFRNGAAPVATASPRVAMVPSECLADGARQGACEAAPRRLRAARSEAASAAACSTADSPVRCGWAWRTPGCRRARIDERRSDERDAARDGRRVEARCLDRCCDNCSSSKLLPALQWGVPTILTTVAASPWDTAHSSALSIRSAREADSRLAAGRGGAPRDGRACPWRRGGSTRRLGRVGSPRLLSLACNVLSEPEREERPMSMPASPPPPLYLGAQAADLRRGEGDRRRVASR